MSAPFPPDTLQQPELPLMSSAAASPAKTSALPEGGRDWRAKDRAYGASSPVLLANFDRDTSSWRTSQHCVAGGLETFSETWPRSGMMRSGIAYQLPPLAPLTAATGYGLWGTPTGQDAKGSQWSTGANGKKLLKLNGQVARWPTPQARDEKTGAANRVGSVKRHGGWNLSDWVVRMVPSPAARDYRSGGDARRMGIRRNYRKWLVGN